MVQSMPRHGVPPQEHQRGTCRVSCSSNGLCQKGSLPAAWWIKLQPALFALVKQGYVRAQGAMLASLNSAAQCRQGLLLLLLLLPLLLLLLLLLLLRQAASAFKHFKTRALLRQSAAATKIGKKKSAQGPIAPHQPLHVGGYTL